MQRRILSGLGALCLAAAALAAPAVAPSPASTAQAGTVSTLGISPVGANDWDCTPDAEHPYPVVLVHGTFETMDVNWISLSPKLKRNGYCVFALNYGFENGLSGAAHVPDSAAELGDFIDRVRQATGAKKVDIVGHSQGGMMPRWYMGHLGGAKYVNDLVSIAPSSHGTQGILVPTATGVAIANSIDTWICDSCADQVSGSDFMTELNAIGDTVAGPDYTVIATKYDEIVMPYKSQFLKGESEQVTNVLLQDKCPLNISGHLGVNVDPVVHRWVLNALATDGPADPGYRPSCYL